jgi:hypothetical protein
VRHDVLKSDADLLCESFNDGPAKWLTEWNFPEAAVPKVWRKVENRARVQAEQGRDKALYDMGLELTDEAIQSRFAGEWRRRAAAPAFPAQGPAFTESREKAFPRHKPHAYSDILAGQLDSLSMDAQSAMLDSVRDLMERVLSEGGDMAAFAERLLENYPLPGMAELGENLAGALVAAKLAGMAGADDDHR